MIKGVRCVVRKWVYGRTAVISKSTWNQLEAVFETEIFGLLADDFLQSFNASDCHLNTNHHVEYHVPVLISNENHASLCIFYPFVYILEGIFRFFNFEVEFLHFLFYVLVNSFGLADYLINLFLNKLELFLKSQNSTILIHLFEFSSSITISKVRFSASITILFHFFIIAFLFEINFLFMMCFCSIVIVWLSWTTAFCFVQSWFSKNGRSWSTKRESLRRLLKPDRFVHKRLLIRHVENSVLDLVYLLDYFVKDSLGVVVLLANEDISNSLSDKLKRLAVVFILIQLRGIVFKVYFRFSCFLFDFFE